MLVRWFEGIEPPVADFLIPILYSREQLAKEGTPITADWGVVGCLYTAEPEEIPMAPITMMRNALGVEQGGSGVPLDREAYQRSVAFWDDARELARIAWTPRHRLLGDADVKAEIPGDRAWLATREHPPGSTSCAHGRRKSAGSSPARLNRVPMPARLKKRGPLAG